MSFDTFADLVETLNGELKYRKHLEEQLKLSKKREDDWHEAATPGWRARELGLALDGERRLMREQG